MHASDEQDPPQPSSGPSIPELLESYRQEYSRLLAQSRALARLRERVLDSAEREAADIMAEARREVRRVVTNARRELVVLAAQLQAVGCDAADALEIEAAAEAAVAHDEGRPLDSGEMLTGARRGIREVLLEARAELAALSEEATALRARMAGPSPLALPVDSDLAGPPEDGQPLQDDAPAVAAASGQDRVVLQTPEAPALVAAGAAAAPPTTGVPAEGVLTSAFPPPSRSRMAWWAAGGVIALVVVAGLLMLASRDGGSNEAAPAPEGAQAAAAVSASPPATGTGAAANRAPVPAGKPAGGPLVVQVEIRRPAWVRTTIDGQADVGRLYKAGETRTVRASREVVMRAGDAGAVVVSVNGAAPAALGADGRVVTRRFAAPGAESAAPTGGTREPETVTGQPRPIGNTGTSGSAAPRGERPASPEPEAAVPSAAERPSGSDRPQADAPATRPPAGDAPAAPSTGPLENTPADAQAAAEIRRLSERWFDAYFSGNAVAMPDVTTEKFAVMDARAAARRIPAGTPGVVRSLEGVHVEMAAGGAVLSGRLVERVPGAGPDIRDYVTLVSAVWTLIDGRWSLMAVRLVDPPAVASGLR